MTQTYTISKWMLTIAAWPMLFFGFGSGQSLVGSCDDLTNINNNLGWSYVLTGNLDCTGSGNNIMIGSQATPFTGSFDGGDFTITLAINTGESHVGLFRRTNGATLSNIGVIGSISGDNFVGGLVGADDGSSITNSYVLGDISGGDYVGGLVGYASYGANITSSYASGNVEGNDQVGGLVGAAGYDTIITNSYALGDASGNDQVGGLVGYLDSDSAITDSFALGDASGNNQVGGLVGYASYGANITSSYASGNIEGNVRVGGLVGYAYIIDISNSYVLWYASGTNSVAGLIGLAEDSSITNSYALGDVSGNNQVGGLVGDAYDSDAINSFWNTDIFATSALGSGKTIAEMKSLSLYNSAWRDIQTTSTDLNNGYPYLSRQVGDSSPVWYIYGIPTTTPPSTPSWGGGWAIFLIKDDCPDGDFSPSYYDGICEGEMTVTQRVVVNLASRRAHLSTAQVQQTLDTLSLLNDKIQEKESVSESMKTLFQDIIDGLLAHYNG